MNLIKTMKTIAQTASNTFSEDIRIEIKTTAASVVTCFIFSRLCNYFGTTLCSEAVALSSLNASDVQNITTGKDAAVASFWNRICILLLQNAFPNSSSNEGKLTMEELSQQFTNSSESVYATTSDGKKALAETIWIPDNYWMVTSVMSLMMAYCIHSKAKDLKELTLWHLLAFYFETLLSYAVLISDQNDTSVEDIMYSSSNISNFFLMVLVTWTSMMSSEPFMLKTYIKNTIVGTYYQYLVSFLFIIMIGIFFMINILIIGVPISEMYECLLFCWRIDEAILPPSFINANCVFVFVVTSSISFSSRDKLGILRDFCCPVCARKRNVLFFSLSVMTYITWGVGGLASYLSSSLLRRIFIIAVFVEGLVLFLVYHKSDLFSHDDSHDNIPAGKRSETSSEPHQRGIDAETIQPETINSAK